MDEVLRYYARSEAARSYANGGPCAQELTARIESHVGGGAHCARRSAHRGRTAGSS
jgi:hypothetical protein